MIDILLGRLDICRTVVRFLNRIALEADVERTARELTLRDLTRTVQLVGFAARRHELLAVVGEIVVRRLRRARADDLDIAVVDALRIDIGILIRRCVVARARAIEIAAIRALPATGNI